MDLGSIVATLKLNAQSFAGGLGSVGDTISSFVSNGVSLFEGLAGGIGTAVVAIGAVVVALGAGAFALAAQADENLRIKQSFDALANSMHINADLMLGKLRDATHGTIDDMALMKMGTEMLNLGIAKNADQVGDLTSMAVRLAHAYGQDVNTSITGVTEALARGRLNSLIPYGINIVDLQTKIKEYVKEHKGMTTQEATRILVLDELNKKVKTLGEDHLTLGDRVKQLQARFENWKQDLGEKLIPVVNNVIDSIGKIKDVVLGFFKILSDNNFADFETALENMGVPHDVIQSIQDFIMNVQDFIGSLRDAINNLINSPIVQEFIKIMRDTIGNIIKNLQDAFQELVKVYQTQLQPSLEKLFTALQPVFQVFGAIAGVVGGVLTIVIGKLIEIFTSLLKPAIDIIVGILKVVIDVITGVITFITNLVKAIVSFVTDAVNRWNTFRNNVEAVFNAVKAIITVVIEYIRAWIQDKINQISDFFHKIKDTVDQVFGGVKSTIEGAFNSARETVKGVINSIIDDINRVLGGINNMIDSVNNATHANIGHIGTLGRLASGTDSAQGGLTLVGEQGMELVNMPKGSSVSPANQTQDLFDKINSIFQKVTSGEAFGLPQIAASLANGSGGGGDIHIHLDGANISSPQVANEYAEMIGNKIIEQLAKLKRTYV